MNKLILATGSNLNYLHKMTGYLKSIEVNSNFDSNYLVFLGDDEMKMKYEKIKIVNVYQKDLEIVPSNYCCSLSYSPGTNVQHLDSVVTID